MSRLTDEEIRKMPLPKIENAISKREEKEETAGNSPLLSCVQAIFAIRSTTRTSLYRSTNFLPALLYRLK